jgi:hypothetical protein
MFPCLLTLASKQAAAPAAISRCWRNMARWMLWEYDEDAHALETARGLCRVEAGALPNAVGFFARWSIRPAIDKHPVDYYAFIDRIMPDAPEYLWKGFDTS